LAAEVFEFFISNTTEIDLLPFFLEQTFHPLNAPNH
jgi:hypothetical protein